MDMGQKLHQAAKKIVALKLEAPAVFFLEAHKPLTTVLHTSAVFLEPAAALFFGRPAWSLIEDILSSRSNVDQLIELIQLYATPNKDAEPVSGTQAARIR